MRDRDVGKVRIYGFYNLIIVVSQLLKLEIKVVQSRDELHPRRVAANDNELLGEDSFDDKPAAVMFQTSFAKQFVETNVLLFIKPERVLMTRRWGLLSGLVGQFSVCIHNIGKKKVATWERPRPRRARTFVGQMPICRTKVQLAPIWRWEKSAAENPERRFRQTLGGSLEAGEFPTAILQPLGAEKKPGERTGADISSEAFYPVVYCCRKEFFIIRILEFIALWQLLQLYLQR